MRPRLLTDEMITGAIRDLAARGRVTGVAVRALLMQRYGAKGSVARIYRLMGTSRDSAPSTRRAAVVHGQSGSLDDALERAALAEEREHAHQLRWARETDDLRVQLAEAQKLAREVHDLRLRVAQLRQALAVAQSRIAQLEPAAATSPEAPST